MIKKLEQKSRNFLKRFLRKNNEEHVESEVTGKVVFRLPEIKKEEGVKYFYLYGHDAELHDRVCNEQGNFHLIFDQIKDAVKNDDDFRLIIGVSRYNFFCLHDIVNFAFSMREETIKLNYSFGIDPVQKVFSRFKEYLKGLQDVIRFRKEIQLVYVDEELDELLLSLQNEIKNNPYKEREYIRLFSIICEKTFLGPATIVMDPHHRCNTNCRHCWVHTPQLTQPQEFLDRRLELDTFKGIVDDAAELKTDLIILQGDGEPLMYEHTMEMLEYIRKNDIEAMFFTNGSLLTEEKARKLIEMDVKEIYCSLPAGTAETYGRTCPMHKDTDFFDRIVKNMKTLMKMRRKMGRERPRLVMTHVMHNANYMDLLDMAKVDAEIGADAVRFYLIRLDTMNIDLKLEREHVDHMLENLGPAEKILKKNGIHFIDNVRFQFEHYDDDTGAWCEDVFLKEGCSIGYFFCLIPALTDLSLCCHLRTIGWLNKTRFKDLWLSKEYERYRRQAKYLKYNKDVTFMNGTKLFDEHCTHCDNHQTLIYNTEEMKRLDWHKYLNL